MLYKHRSFKALLKSYKNTKYEWNAFTMIQTNCKDESAVFTTVFLCELRFLSKVVVGVECNFCQCRKKNLLKI